jgi:hypothetical protein
MGHLRQIRRRRLPRDLVALLAPESHVRSDRGCSSSRWLETVEWIVEDSGVVVVHVCMALEVVWDEPTSV